MWNRNAWLDCVKYARLSRSVRVASASFLKHPRRWTTNLKTMSFTAAQIAEKVRGEVLGDGTTPLTGFSAADNARAGDLTFADKQEYFVAAEQSAATAILISGDFTSTQKVLIRVPNARIAVARLL